MSGTTNLVWLHQVHWRACSDSVSSPNSSHPLFRDMKVLVILAVLVLCCSSTVVASPFSFPRCNDTQALSYISTLNCTEPCSSQCFGALCSFYTTNSYSALCNEAAIEMCRQYGSDMVPSTCGTPSARACTGSEFFTFVETLPTVCLSNDQPCTDQCFGAACTHYSSTSGYSSVCSPMLEAQCLEMGSTVPAACESSGALRPDYRSVKFTWRTSYLTIHTCMYNS